MSEAGAMQTTWKALHAPQAKAGLSREQQIKLEQSLADHAQNIRALEAEIKRAKGEKAKSGKP